MGITDGKGRDYSKERAYWSNELWEAECTNCNKIGHYHEFRADLEQTNKNVREMPKRRPVGSLCRDCIKISNANRYLGMSMEEMTYSRYKGQMRSEGNGVDLTFEEFMKYWPKDNRCPVRQDITFQRYPEEDREMWTKGGRHWPFTPTIDHFYPDRPLSKDNFWIISWRANEMKSDMFVIEIEALYRAIKRFKGDTSVGKDILRDIDVAYRIDEIKRYVGKYPPECLESVKIHRKL